MAGWGRRIGLGVLCIGFLYALAACTSSNAKQAKPALLKPVQEKMQVMETKKGSIIKDISGVGTLVSRGTQYLFFTTDGLLGKVAVRPGDRVKKGDVLLQLDEGDLSRQIKKQQLALETMKRALDEAKTAGQAEIVKIRTMNVEIEQKRLQILTDRSAKLELVSPMDGVITFLDPFIPGEKVTAYAPVIGIAGLNGSRIEYINSNTLFFNGIKVDMPVTVDYKGQTYQAKVVLTPDTLDNGSGQSFARYYDFDTLSQDAVTNDKMIIEFIDGPPAEAVLGEPATFTVVIDRKDNVIKIPRVALHTSGAGDFVKLMDGDILKEADVKTGLATATEVEIAEGLKEGMRLVLN